MENSPNSQMVFWIMTVWSAFGFAKALDNEYSRVCVRAFWHPVCFRPLPWLQTATMTSDSNHNFRQLPWIQTATMTSGSHFTGSRALGASLTHYRGSSLMLVTRALEQGSRWWRRTTGFRKLRFLFSSYYRLLECNSDGITMGAASSPVLVQRLLRET